MTGFKPILVAVAAMLMPMRALAEAPTVPWQPQAVIALAERVGDYQLATLAGGKNPDPKGWVQGALFVGLTALADHSDRPEFKQAILARGVANDWQPGDRKYDADDFVIAQSYIWAASHGAGPEALVPIRQHLDAILADPPRNDLTFVGDGKTCRDRWCWCDSLFMAPPVWLAMTKITGDPRYADYAKSEFNATAARLYDPKLHLWYRDSRFFDRSDSNGNKLFWSRGNGWVFAGLAHMIPLLPEGDPERAKMVTIFKDMAIELKSIQKPDGYWSPSLLGDPATSLPESSGTGFYTYGFAWGVKAGILNAADYEPVVRKGWAALVRSVHPDGKLGYVQPVSDRPDAVSYDDTALYGVGAFLLAATAVADLDLRSQD
ncbi:glycoside hydrolase family 88 protein [Asticcacaulis sp. EMRT-3]|uniref:glycoside hydrolase family 88/105 protein n=1 Tax=Asticcacaulis sp. EMRT-3 TaxID=3040349 RepID=UPI0024AF55F1|nr:glycoside hydrolase family 88 protein [Asticcacaulis sp. EMRT-3]MDI7773925.1 glycoside hydrolase family 88 protein [Asticcacaulis sp. EMRT-3]